MSRGSKKFVAKVLPIASRVKAVRSVGRILQLFNRKSKIQNLKSIDRTKMKMRTKIKLETMPPKSAVNGVANGAIAQTDTPTCAIPHFVDSGRAREMKTQVLNTPKAQRMAEFFSLLGDANRLRLLSVLADRELCVCDLAAALSMTESAVSHQLRALRAMRLVSYRKVGRQVFYSLLDRHVLELYNAVAEHLDEE